MRTIAAFGDAGQPTSLPTRVSSDLILTVGTPSFEQVLVEAGHALTGADHVSAFALRGEKPALVVAASRGSKANCRAAAAAYLANDYWRQDPALIWFSGTSGGRGWSSPAKRASSLQVAILSSDEISDSKYRRDCYGVLGAAQKISLFRQFDTYAIVLSFYISKGACALGDNALERLATAAFFLTASVAKHQHLSGDKSAKGEWRAGHDALAERLTFLGRGLTARELQVCSRILSGATTEAIGLDLGLSASSVVTFRRRAYARLSISSQNELFRLCLETS